VDPASVESVEDPNLESGTRKARISSKRVFNKMKEKKEGNPALKSWEFSLRIGGFFWAFFSFWSPKT
jgi:hypothetical protein